MEVIYNSFGILFLVFTAITSLYSIKITLTYRDMQSVFFTAAISTINLWLFTKALFFLEVFFPFISDSTWQQIYSVGNMGLIGGAISFIHITDHRFQRRTTRFFSRAGFILYSMILALSIVDIVSQRPLFYTVSRINSNWYINVHLLGAMLLIAALMFTVLIFFSLLNWANYLAKAFEPPQKKSSSKYMVLISSLSAAVVLGITVAGLTSFDDIPLNLGIIIITPTLFLFSSFFIYITYTKPYFLMLTGINPVPLLTRGHVGYLLAAYMDKGPETLFVSPAFKERTEIDDFSLDKLGLSVLSLLSVLGDRNSIENVSLLPLSSSYRINALVFTFNSRNPGGKEQRTAMLFAVLIPQIMTLAVSNMVNALPLVLEKIKEKTVKELADQDFLEELAVKVLKKLLE